MSESRRPPCDHFQSRKCVHPDQPFGKWPVDIECLQKCDRYSGPDRGLGDTIARFTQVTGIDKAVKTATSIASAVTGKKKDCGCGGRRKALNQVVPYKPPCDECDKSGKPD